MDGLMAIPAILLAIAVIGRSPAPISRRFCVAIAIPEIPRVARLVRSVVLTVREEPMSRPRSAWAHEPAEDPVAAHLMPNVPSRR
jgi:peptide/nickel transport system permease protein